MARQSLISQYRAMSDSELMDHLLAEITDGEEHRIVLIEQVIEEREPKS